MLRSVSQCANTIHKRSQFSVSVSGTVSLCQDVRSLQDSAAAVLSLSHTPTFSHVGNFLCFYSSQHYILIDFSCWNIVTFYSFIVFHYLDIGLFFLYFLSFFFFLFLV